MDTRLGGGVVEATARPASLPGVLLLPPRPKNDAMAEPKDCACAGAVVPAIARTDPVTTEIRVLETLTRIRKSHSLHPHQLGLPA